MSTERPILFSAPMVRALLNGSKTQTRRKIKPQPADDIAPATFPNTEAIGWMSSLRHQHGRQTAHFCPHGKPGDKLWVKEAYRLCAEADGVKPRDTDAAYRVWCEADAPHQPGYGKLRPGIFMPRWASRIALELTGVRVERLQDISEADALAEGVRQYSTLERIQAGQDRWARHAYRSLWESINGQGSWDANPWVWALTFRRAA